MQAPVTSFNRKHSRTYNERIKGRMERRENNRKEIDPNKYPINHYGNSYLAAKFLENKLNNGGFLDEADLREKVSQYIGHQGGFTPPLNRVKQKLPDYMFSIITRMPYRDELLREYLELQTASTVDDAFY